MEATGTRSIQMNYQNWVKAQLSQLDTLTDFGPIEAEDLRETIREAESLAAINGLPEAVQACQIREGGIGIGLARRILAACLEGSQTPEPLAMLTPPQLAKEWHISPDKVLGWIRSGELKARNVSQGNRPRYLIDRETLESFRPPKEKPAKLRRRKLPEATQYF